MYLPFETASGSQAGVDAGAKVVCADDGGEQTDELLALRSVESSEKFVLEFIEHPMGAGNCGDTGFRGVKRVHPSVDTGRSPFNETVALKVVEHGHHAVAVNVEQVTQLLLRQATVGDEGVDHCEVARGETVRFEEGRETRCRVCADL